MFLALSPPLPHVNTHQVYKMSSSSPIPPSTPPPTLSLATRRRTNRAIILSRIGARVPTRGEILSGNYRPQRLFPVCLPPVGRSANSSETAAYRIESVWGTLDVYLLDRLVNHGTPPPPLWTAAAPISEWEEHVFGGDWYKCKVWIASYDVSIL